MTKLYGRTLYYQTSCYVLKKTFPEWFIKCSGGYIFSIPYKFINFIPLQYEELATHQISCAPDVKNKMCLTRILPFIASFQNYSRLHQWTNIINLIYKSLKDIIMRASSQSHDDTHLQILATLLEVFLRHLFYCHGKTFHEGYDKINEFSNFKYNHNLVSWFKIIPEILLLN